MKIACLIDAMNLGGAQRVKVLLAEGLAARGHDITITTFNPSIPDFYTLKPDIKRVNIPMEAGLCRWFNPGCQIKRLRALKSCLSGQAPDVIISFIDTANILALAAFPSGKPPVIACEHINPLYFHLGPHWRALRRMLYPLAAKVVMLTEDTLKWAESLRPRWNATAIPNPVVPPVFSENAGRPAFFTKSFNLLALGRLHEQKGFDILINAFAEIADRFPQWQLTIVGDGPERNRLETIIKDLGLTGRVIIPGATDKPFDVLRYADLFVMSSRYEGFGMVLAEAMSCGVPAVSFDCPSGPGILIRDKVDGLLVPPGDTAALGTAMAALMSDDARRRQMAQKAPDVIQRFSLEKYLNTWEALLRNTVK